MVRPQELNPRPPALQSNALPTEQILPRSTVIKIGRKHVTMASKVKSKDKRIITGRPHTVCLYTRFNCKFIVNVLNYIYRLLYL